MNTFPKSASKIRQLGNHLVQHLNGIPDTQSSEEWTSENLAALRSFDKHGLDVKHFPPSKLSNQKGAFLWDYIAYQQGGGILIVAESEHDNRSSQGLRHDFEKLFYAVAPIKLFMFRGNRDDAESTDAIVRDMRTT